MKLIIKLKDEVNCVFIGLQKHHKEELYDLYGLHPPNYFFHPKFKLGQWDGKIRFFTKTGQTYINLLPEIIPLVIRWGYVPDLQDERRLFKVTPKFVTEDIFSHIIHPKSNKPVILRDYQVNSANAVIKNGGGVIIAATGAGKTFINGALVKIYGDEGYKCMTIVPSSDLVSQTTENLCRLELDVGEYSGNVKQLNKQHIVSTWQALQNNPTILHNMDVVILDECHGARGNVIQDLLVNHGKSIAVRFGLTGTMPKDETDAIAVHIAIGLVQYTVTARELIDAGVLADLRIDIYQTVIDLTKQYEDFKGSLEGGKLSYRQFKEQYFPDFTSERHHTQTNSNRIGYIVDFYKKQRQNGNVFVLVNGVAFGRKLAKLMGAYFVHGKDHKEIRKQIYSLFDDNDDVLVVATVGVAAVGLDIPRIFHLGLIDIGKSFIRTIQSIGRGLRTAEDKNFVSVSDFCTDLVYSKRHLTKRKKYYKEADYPFKVHVTDITPKTNVDLIE